MCLVSDAIIRAMYNPSKTIVHNPMLEIYNVISIRIAYPIHAVYVSIFSLEI